ncbi:MAG: ATP-binding cassette domain-containing protein [Burkholderiales bacterium]|nr:ATP-binding cassette domain-containing protein [Burkholderiales bacterium]
MDAAAVERTRRGAARSGAVSLDNPATIELSHVRLAHGRRVILRDVSLSIGQGEFIGVLGPNGAGKTTLMRALLGLVAPDAGAIRVLGKPVARGNPDIGYMPQVRSTMAGRRLRGRDFVACAADGHRWGVPHLDRAARAAIEHALAIVGAQRLADRPLAELSGGERQRLLLAQCLLGEPKLLLLDEPLISLDPNHQAGVVDLVRRIQRELNITVLFSAHELNPLLGALDRVLYLGNGDAALGPVAEVITGPVLSRLYGAPIDVMRVNGRIFVMSGGVEIEKHDHQHESGHEHGDTDAHRHQHHEAG